MTKMIIKAISGVVFSTLLLSSCNLINSVHSTHSNSSTSSAKGKAFSGQASYYARKFHGRRTASGEVYDKNKLTAAHKTLPFQTKVEVKNLKNGKTVVVKINDRLPASSKRSIDLSEAAAKKIDMIRDGVVNVRITVLQ